MINYRVNTLKLESVLYQIALRHQRKDCTKPPEVLSRGIFQKIGYCIDFGYYARYKKKLTGEIYVHSDNGPVPIHFDIAINNLITDDRLKISEDGCFEPVELEPGHEEQTEPEFYGVAYHILPVLKEEEVDFINRVVDCLSRETEDELKERVNNDLAWISTKEGQVMDYGYSFYHGDIIGGYCNDL